MQSIGEGFSTFRIGGPVRVVFKFTVENQTHEDARINDDLPKTITVPDAGREYFGFSRNAAYAAAQRGDIPTIKIGKLLRIPVIALQKMLERTEGPLARRDTSKNLPVFCAIPIDRTHA